MNRYIDLDNGQIKAKICTLGAQLVGISDVISGQQYLWRGGEKRNEEWNFSAPILFPICGKLKNDRYIYQNKEYTLQKHGFARFKKFNIESLTKSKCVLTLKDDDSTVDIYPFKFKLSVTFELNDKNVIIGYAVTNTNNNRTLYFSIGSHEGYQCKKLSDHYFIEFEDDSELQRYLLNDGIYDNKIEITKLTNHYLPISYQELDRCTYIFKAITSSKIYLCDDKKNRILSVGIEECDVLAIWSKRNSHFICIEPWNGFPDTVLCSGELSEKEGIIRLSAGETYSYKHSITVLDQKNILGDYNENQNCLL